MNMKRILALVLALTLAFSLVMPASVFADGETVTVTYTVDGAVFTTQTVEMVSDEVWGNLGTVTQPEQIPTKADANGIHYVFAQWVSEQGTPFFNNGVASVETDATVTAQFEEHLADGYQLVVNTANGPEYRTDTSKTITELTGNDEFIRIEAITLESAPMMRNGNPVAQIGEDTYGSLADAFAAVQDGETIKLLDNVTLTAALDVTVVGKSVTLDLNKKTLSGRTNLKGGSLTIKNGTVAGGDQQALNVYGSDNPAENYSVLTLNSNVTVTADMFALCLFGKTYNTMGYGAVINTAAKITTTGNGAEGAVFVSGNLGKNVSGDANNVINVTGGSITSATDAGIALNGLATVNISGGTVKGNTAVAVKRGTLNVTGGTVSATGAKNYPGTANYNGTEMTGAAISVTETYNNYGPLAVNVSGGTVKSANADPVYVKDATYPNGATVTLTGGTYSAVEPNADFIPADYGTIKTSVTEWKVIPETDRSKYVVEVTDANGNVYYKTTTFGTSSGTKNKLLGNMTGRYGAGMFETGTVEIDLNGYTLTSTSTTAPAILARNDQTVIVKNGKIVSSDYGVWVSAPSAKIIVEDVDITASTHAVYAENGTVEVHSGSFKIVEQDKKYLVNLYDANGIAGTANVIITGGEFYGFDPSNSNSEPGGPVSFVADGYAVYASGDKYVVAADDAAVAQIGEAKFLTLVDAVAAVKASANKTGTVTLLEDCSGAGIFLAAADQVNLTIDFNGHTYTCSGPAVGSTGTQSQAFHLEKNNTVTLMNGKVTSTSNSGVSMIVQNYSNLTLEGIELDGTNIPGNGRYTLSNNCGNVVIGDGTIVTAKDGSYAFDVCVTNYYPQGVTVTVEDGAVINGTVQYDVWGTKPAENKTALVVNGGTFNGIFEIESALADDAKDKFSFTGGTFATDPSAYVVEGYEAVKSGANFVVVAEGAAQAEMNGVKYATLRDAYLAALAGGTGNTYEIELLKDAEGPAWGSDGDAAITYSVDFNGFTYTVTRPSVGSVGYETQAVRVISGQTVTMENGTITSSDAKMLFNVYSDLTLNNMVLDGSNLVNVASGNYTLSDNKGNIVVNDTTIIPHGDANDFAFDVWGGYNGGKTNVSVTITGNSVIQGAFEYTAASEGYSAVLTIEGGTFATDPSAYLAEGYECNAQGDVYVVEAHVHTYGNPDWNWRLINGNWAAVASFNCVKGDDTQNVRATITSEEDSVFVTYTATVNFQGQEYREHKELQRFYRVFFEGFEQNYAWGELCTLNSLDGMNKKWFINDTLVADGRSSYTFAVTATAEVTTMETEEQNPVAVMSAMLYSPVSGEAVYKVKWSLPTGSEVVSAMIYRGAKSSDEPATVELLTSKGAKIDTGMYVRNGDFTLNITGLSPTKYQNVVAVITYRVGGQTKTLIPNCGVLNVQADGPDWA